jgi:hypothetical protein
MHILLDLFPFFINSTEKKKKKRIRDACKINAVDSYRGKNKIKMSTTQMRSHREECARVRIVHALPVQHDFVDALTTLFGSIYIIHQWESTKFLSD